MVERGDAAGALQTLQLLHGDEGSAKAELDTIKAHQSEEEASGNVLAANTIRASFWPSYLHSSTN